MGKVNKKVNSEVLEMSPYTSNGVPQSCLDPLKLCKLNIIMFVIKMTNLNIVTFKSF